MRISKELLGCGTALVTPFTKEKKIDFKNLKSLVCRQIDSGIDFLVPCGTTGENACMSMDEHLNVVGTVVDTVNGKVPVLAGAGGYNTVHVLEMASEVAKQGADAILSVVPYYNKPTQQGLFEHFKTIAEGVELPIVLYNVPGRTGCNLLPDTILKLSEIDNIIAVKEASGNIDQLVDLALLLPDDFSILSGDDAISLPIIALGGKGVISVISNEIPKQMCEFVHCCLDGQFKKALDLQKYLQPLMSMNFIETNPIPVKTAMAMMALLEENFRLPLVPMSKMNRDKLKDCLQKMRLI